MSIPYSYIYDEVAFYSCQSLNDKELLSELCLNLLPIWDCKFKYFDDGLLQERFNADDSFILEKHFHASYCAIFSLQIYLLMFNLFQIRIEIYFAVSVTIIYSLKYLLKL